MVPSLCLPQPLITMSGLIDIAFSTLKVFISVTFLLVQILCRKMKMFDQSQDYFHLTSSKIS